MYDLITNLGNSVIQHGTFNDRIYLMKLSRDDFPDILPKLDSLVSQNGYTKIFAKVPDFAKDTFLNEGYELEAQIPGFYSGIQRAYFLGKYFSPERKQIQNSDTIHDVLAAAHTKASAKLQGYPLPDDYTPRQCERADILEISELYKNVFETYPFPIHDSDYILKTMQDNVTYFGVWNNKRLISIASTEMDLRSENVEMTDFATLPDYLGKGLSVYLLNRMENYVKTIGLKTTYTIARSLSYGMNITFAKMGYTYSGTLKNNTNISGSLESMNVWYKLL